MQAPLILLFESGSQMGARRKESVLLLFKLNHSYHESGILKEPKDCLCSVFLRDAVSFTMF